MWTPEAGQDVEVIIRGRVKRIACNGHLAVLERIDGREHLVEIPTDLMGAIEWRKAE